MTSPSAERLVGVVLSGRYRVESLVSDDGAVASFIAEHTHMRKRVSVRVLSASAARVPEQIARFEREAIAGAHVDHANVTLAKDFGALEDGSQFLVMELLEGPTLRARMDRGHFPTGQALRVARQLALALDAVHRTGIVHRAVCPEHVVLVERGGETDVVKLFEFGSAKLPEQLIARAGPAKGAAEHVKTPIGSSTAMVAYTAPEILSGSEPDARSDLFALGVILVELVTGGRPQQARGIVPTLPPGVREIAAALLAENPDARPESGAAVAERLGAMGGGGVTQQPARATMQSVPMHPPPVRATVQSMPGAGRVSRVSNGDMADVVPAFTAPRNFASNAGRSRPLVDLPRRSSCSSGAPRGIVLLVLGAIAVRSPVEEVAEVSPQVLPSGAASAGSAQARDGAPPGGVGTTPLVSVGGVPPAGGPAGGPAGAPTTSIVGTGAGAGRTPPPMDFPTGNNTREVRSKLQKDLQTGNYKAAVADIDQLLRMDPSQKEDRDLRNLIVDLAMRIMVGQGPECDQLFDIMSSRMGTRGIDLLYELVTTRGGSKAAKRASETLKDAEVFARGSPGMRIAYDMRNTKCEARPALFERAKTDADARTLGMLQEMNKECRSRSGQCCLGNDARLKAAIAAIRARIE